MLHSDNSYACLRDNNSVGIFFKQNNKTHTHTRAQQTHTQKQQHAQHFDKDKKVESVIINRTACKYVY